MDGSLSFVKFRFLDSRTLDEMDFRGASFSLQLGILSGADDVVTY